MMIPESNIQDKYDQFKRSLVHQSAISWSSDLFSGESFSILFFEKGDGILKINGNSFSLFPGTCLCFNNKDEVEALKLSEDYHLHRIQFVPAIINSQFNINNLYNGKNSFHDSEILDLYWLTPFLERSDKFQGLFQIGSDSTLRVKRLFDSIGKELEKQCDQFWPCRSRSYFIELLNFLNDIHQSPSQVEHINGDPESDKVHHVIQYINENYYQKITIKKLTQRFNTNRTTLSNIFLKTIGMSIISYVTKVRIKIACTLLKETTLPIIEIMDRVGFQDISHFGRVFKKEMGMPPGTFRSDHKK